MSDGDAAIFTHAFIKNKYCNSLLYGMSDNVINRLQKLQNIAVCILTKNFKQCHITLSFDRCFRLVAMDPSLQERRCRIQQLQQ